jgi:hypothetical protein
MYYYLRSEAESGASGYVSFFGPDPLVLFPVSVHCCLYVSPESHVSWVLLDDSFDCVRLTTSR